MKFYRVRYSADGGNSGGYSWHTARRDAEKALAVAMDNHPFEYRDLVRADLIDEIPVEPTKAGILAALNRYADHASNG